MKIYQPVKQKSFLVLWNEQLKVYFKFMCYKCWFITMNNKIAVYRNWIIHHNTETHWLQLIVIDYTQKQSIRH